MTAAQIKTMVNQLGTRQDTSELQDRLYVPISSPLLNKHTFSHLHFLRASAATL